MAPEDTVTLSEFPAGPRGDINGYWARGFPGPFCPHPGILTGTHVSVRPQVGGDSGQAALQVGGARSTSLTHDDPQGPG